MKRFLTLTATGLILTLAGCGGVADSLGLGRNPPDEFAVVDRPPLSLPPDYTLHPPKPGAPRPQDVNMTARASQVVFGANKVPNTDERAAAIASDGTKSDAEKSVLEAAGAAKAEPNIRTTIDRETSERVVGNRHLVDEMLWWKDSGKPAAVVDAKAEHDRLEAAKEKGETAVQSATPVIEREKHFLIGL